MKELKLYKIEEKAPKHEESVILFLTEYSIEMGTFIYPNKHSPTKFKEDYMEFKGQGVTLFPAKSCYYCSREDVKELF